MQEIKNIMDWIYKKHGKSLVAKKEKHGHIEHVFYFEGYNRTIIVGETESTLFLHVTTQIDAKPDTVCQMVLNGKNRKWLNKLQIAHVKSIFSANRFYND